MLENLKIICFLWGLPHFSSFVDLDGDCKPDLVLVVKCKDNINEVCIGYIILEKGNNTLTEFRTGSTKISQLIIADFGK